MAPAQANHSLRIRNHYIVVGQAFRSTDLASVVPALDLVSAASRVIDVSVGSAAAGRLCRDDSRGASVPGAHRSCTTASTPDFGR